MKSYKDFFIDHVAEYGYGPLDDEYLEYVAHVCDDVKEQVEHGQDHR